MRLYFIRHGQSANNALWDATGGDHGRSDDPELTDIGRQQAALLSAFLARERAPFGITHIYTSLMIRAVETALAISGALALPVRVWEDVHETGGIFLEDDRGQRIGRPGKARAHFEATYPTLILPDTLNAHGWWNRAYEDTQARPVRAQRFVQALLAQHGSTLDRVAIVSHGNFYRYMMAAILHIPDPDSYYFPMNNGALSRIDFPERDGEATLIAYLNRCDYLPRELWT